MRTGVSLILLERYIAQAPKQLLSELYRHWFPQETGLISNSQIAVRIKERAFDTERLKQLFFEMTPLQRRLLGAIYGSSWRGASSEELLLSVPETERFLVDDTLEEFRRELLIGRSSNSRKLLGFSDLWPDLSDLFSSQLSPVDADRLPWVNLENFAPQHLLRLLTLVQGGEWHFTRGNELAKRFRQQYEEGISFQQQLSDTAVGEEFDLLLHLALREGWVVRTDEKLSLSQEGYALSEESQHQLQQKLLEAWLRRRQINAPALRSLLSMLATPRHPGAWCEFFWIHEGPRRHDLPESGPMAWAALPEAVRELVLLGMVQVSQKQTKEAVSLSLSSTALFWCESGEFQLIPEQRGFPTADFEVLLPGTTTGPHVWTLHKIAQLTTDDRLMKFQLGREKLLEALRTNFPAAKVRQLADWLQLPDAPSRHLEEWLRSFESCRFTRHLLLEVRDDRLRREIAAVPTVETWILEELKGYGLLLRDGAEAVIAPLLEEFGLAPAPWPPIENALPKARIISTATPPETEELDTEWVDAPASEELRLGELSPAAHHFRGLDELQRERLLNYSIRNRRMLHIHLRSAGGVKGHSVRVIPEAIQKGKTPQLLGTDSSGEAVQILLDEIANLRIPS